MHTNEMAYPAQSRGLFKSQNIACDATQIIRGGFTLNNGTIRPDPIPLRAFPPPSNAAYDLTSNGHDPKFVSSFRSGSDGLASLLECMQTPEEMNNELTTAVGDGVTKGETLAGNIDFERPTWVTTTPGVSGAIYPAAEQREDFVKSIDSGTGLEYCHKCETKHIPPGSPITLQDRDTCGSYLPEWFPAERIDKPWDTYAAMLNEIVTLDEILQGYKHKPNPDQPEWDLEYHDAGVDWKVVGRRSGWWKCRSDPDASVVERKCTLCHPQPTQEVAVAPRRVISVLERKKALEDFIDKQVKEIGARDRAIVEERIRTHGWPQHLGPSQQLCPSLLLSWPQTPTTLRRDD